MVPRLRPLRAGARLGSRALGFVIAVSLAWTAGAALAAPALWSVRGPRATVYLFGTVHVLKTDAAWRDARIDAALQSADSLWLEVRDADDPAVMQPLILKYGLGQTPDLTSTLDAATRSRLAALMTRLGLPVAMLERMRPWLAGLTLGVLPLIKAGYDPTNGVEPLIKARMIAAGHPVRGFETAEEQIRYLADLSPDSQAEFLRSSIDDAETAEADLDKLVAAWMAGEEATLESLLNSDMKVKYPDLYKRLLADRNARFAARIADLAKGKGVIFVAVGAAHLVGPDSVQADLGKLGLVAHRE